MWRAKEKKELKIIYLCQWCIDKKQKVLAILISLFNFTLYKNKQQYHFQKNLGISLSVDDMSL